jgi:hypothetical protein
VGRRYSCAERLVLNVRRNERKYKRVIAGTSARSNRKGSKDMYSRLKKIAGYVFIELMLTAVFVGMVIAMAVIPY